MQKITQLNKDNCDFWRERVEFFGFIFDAAGKRPVPSEVESILNTPEFKIIQEFQPFLAFIIFMRDSFLAWPVTGLEPYLVARQSTQLAAVRTGTENGKTFLVFGVNLRSLRSWKPWIITCDSWEYGGSLERVTGWNDLLLWIPGHFTFTNEVIRNFIKFTILF